MNQYLKILLFSFLVLVQITILPLNLAFAFLVGVCLYFEETNFVLWLGFLSVLLSVLTGYNLGAILIGLTVAFGAIQFVSRLVPRNNLSRILLIILSVPMSEFFLVYFLKIF